MKRKFNLSSSLRFICLSFLVLFQSLGNISQFHVAEAGVNETFTYYREKISLIVIPDTQYMALQMGNQQLTYLEAYLKRINLDNYQYILHVGDLVENVDSTKEWIRIQSTLLPYKNIIAISPGNHDMRMDGTTPNLSMFNHYFGDFVIKRPSDYIDLEVYPFFSSNKMLNNVKFYRSLNSFNLTVVLTHSFTNNNSLTTEGLKLYPYLSRSTNYFVISGHYGRDLPRYFYRFEKLSNNLTVLGFNAQFDPDTYKIGLITIFSDHINVSVIDYFWNTLVSSETISYNIPQQVNNTDEVIENKIDNLDLNEDLEVAELNNSTLNISFTSMVLKIMNFRLIIPIGLVTKLYMRYKRSKLISGKMRIAGKQTNQIS